MGIVTAYQLVKNNDYVGDSIDIDKSETYLALGLNALGLDGDYIVGGFGGPSDDYGDPKLSPAVVKKNWQALRDVTFEQLLNALQTTDSGRHVPDGHIDYLKHHFETLKKVYGTAADTDAGIVIWNL